MHKTSQKIASQLENIVTLSFEELQYSKLPNKRDVPNKRDGTK